MAIDNTVMGGRTIIVHPTGLRRRASPTTRSLENVGAATENAHRSISELVAVA